MTELVVLPNIMPGPPVAKITASARNALISIERKSWATMPRQTPSSSNTADSKFPMLVFLHKPCRFIAAHLLVQRIQQLLAGCRPCERRAMVLGAAEPAEIKQPFRRTVEHDAHPVHQVNDARRRFTHRFHRRLVGQKVAAIYRIVKMQPRRIAFSFRIHRTVNAALRAYGVRTFHRHKREQIDPRPRFSRLNRQPSARPVRRLR